MQQTNRRWWAAPLAALYGAGIAIRHLLYDEHVLRTYSPHIPTICVGNLAVGGTGKTPMVEYLIRLLQRQGYSVGVLSRGYKRQTKGLLLAADNATADSIGDEPMQIHRKFPDVLVAVCESRVKAIKLIEQMPNRPDVIILDDAYQHRSLRCGLTILLTAFDRLYVHDHLLPWGTLRDIPYRATKANIVVVTKCPESLLPIDKRVADSSLKLATFQRLYFSRVHYGEIKLAGIPLLITGIATPEYVIEHIRSIEPRTLVITFADHHRFTPGDVEDILQRAEQCGCIITTEKDMERIRQTDLLERCCKPVIELPIHVSVDKEAHSFDEDVLTYVRESMRKLKDSLTNKQ